MQGKATFPARARNVACRIPKSLQIYLAKPSAITIHTTPLLPHQLLVIDELKARFETWRTNVIKRSSNRSRRASNCASPSRSCPRSSRAISASISAESVEFWSGSLLHERRRRFYAASRSETRASETFLHFSRSFPASTRLSVRKRRQDCRAVLRS
jgi:hypothetical protein